MLDLHTQQQQHTHSDQCLLVSVALRIGGGATSVQGRSFTFTVYTPLSMQLLDTQHICTRLACHAGAGHMGDALGHKDVCGASCGR